MNGITVAQPIIRTRQLTVEELRTIDFPIKIQGNFVIIDHGLTGHKLKTQVALELEKVLAVKEKGLINYILTSFISERPALIPFSPPMFQENIGLGHTRAFSKPIT